MKYVDDITKLFTSFGANAGSYQEIQPNYQHFKDEPVTATSSVAEQEPTAPLPSLKPTATVLVPDEPKPALLIDAPVEPAKSTVVPLPSATGTALSGESPADSATGGRQRLGDLLRELNQARKDGLPSAARTRTGAKVIAIVSANGGVGKSTVAAGLAKTLRRPGGRTIAIDLDPQNALSSHLGIAKQAPGLFQLKQPPDADWQTYCLPGYGGSVCLPNGPHSESESQALKQQMLGNPGWLSQHLAAMKLSENDIVILDTPSGTSVYAQQALEAADLVLVVAVADAASYLALDAMAQRLKTRHQGAQRPRYVLNQQDDFHSLSLDMGVLFQRRLGADLIGTVHLDHQFNESLAYGRDPLQYSPNSIGCQDILALSRSVQALLAPDSSGNSSGKSSDISSDEQCTQ